MSELISGKEAWIAKTENKDVEWRMIGIDWSELTDLEFMSWNSDRFVGLKTNYQFRLKPQTIKINGIEVEKPENIAVDTRTCSVCFVYGDLDKTEKVANALRSVFNG